jgi:Niemann-Pick C1 protein
MMVHVDAGKDDGARCPPPDQPPCSDSGSTICNDCQTCLSTPLERLSPSNLTLTRPTGSQFADFLPWFLEAPPSASCAKGGLGVYTDYVRTNSATGAVVGLDAYRVTSSFRSLSAPLSAQTDFMSALANSRDLVDAANDKLHDVHSGMPLFVHTS